MATTTQGIERSLDELGRIVIPIELRRQLGLTPGTMVEITKVGDTIQLREPGPSCTTCNGTGRL